MNPERKIKKIALENYSEDKGEKMLEILRKNCFMPTFFREKKIKKNYKAIAFFLWNQALKKKTSKKSFYFLSQVYEDFTLNCDGSYEEYPGRICRLMRVLATTAKDYSMHNIFEVISFSRYSPQQGHLVVYLHFIMEHWDELFQLPETYELILAIIKQKYRMAESELIRSNLNEFIFYVAKELLLSCETGYSGPVAFREPPAPPANNRDRLLELLYPMTLHDVCRLPELKQITEFLLSKTYPLEYISKESCVLNCGVFDGEILPGLDETLAWAKEIAGTIEVQTEIKGIDINNTTAPSIWSQVKKDRKNPKDFKYSFYFEKMLLDWDLSSRSPVFVYFLIGFANTFSRWDLLWRDEAFENILREAENQFLEKFK